MGLFELFRHIRLSEDQGIDTRDMQVLFHMRLAIPWAALVLALLQRPSFAVPLPPPPPPPVLNPPPEPPQQE